jgi:hypothetical protein
MSDHDPFDIYALDEAEADRKARTARELEDEIGDLKWLMSNKRGRRVVWRLLEKAGLYRSSFNNSGSITAFNEGQRNVGLRLMALIHTHCAEQYMTLLQEKNSG